MRARSGLSIFCLALTACGARSEIAGGSPEITDASADKVIESCEMGLFSFGRTGSRPDTIVLDGPWVYWHDADGVFRIDKNGGAPETLGKPTSSFWPNLAALAVGGGHVLYADGSTLVLDGKTLGSLASAETVASSAHFFAWARDSTPTEVRRFDFDGANESPFQVTTGNTTEMTFTTSESPCVAADPGVQCGAQLLSGLSATDIAVSGDDVFFTSNDATNGARVMHLVTPSLKTVPIADTTGAFALAQDDSNLYFTDDHDFRVRRIEGKTGVVVDIAKTAGKYEPIDIAVDDKCVYWTNAPIAPDTQGWVMAAPKK